MKNLNEEQIGTIYAISAFLFWGMIPIYFKQVADVDSFEVLIHRIIWSVVVLSFLLYFTKQNKELKIILKDFTQLKYLLLSSFFVSLNWLVFIIAISNDKILETSLGYFINPLVSIWLGYMFFDEKMNKNQKIAIAIVVLAILLQVFTLGYIPVISLALAFSFAFYGMVRKKVNIASIPGLFVETLLIFPLAVLYLIYLISNNESAFLGDSNYTTLMLLLAGLITVIPLLWFNAGVTRIKLTTIGMIQYIGPSVAFLIAIFVYDEQLNMAKFTTFGLIWFALAIFSFDAIKTKRKYKNTQ